MNTIKAVFNSCVLNDTRNIYIQIKGTDLVGIIRDEEEEIWSYLKRVATYIKNTNHNTNLVLFSITLYAEILQSIPLHWYMSVEEYVTKFFKFPHIFVYVPDTVKDIVKPT